jgi:hypothetical protein
LFALLLRVVNVLMKLEAEQHLLLVGEVPDDLSERWRELLDQCRRREDLVVFRELWMLEYVDDLELILSAQLLFADAAQVRDCRLGSRCRSGDVELQDERGQASSPGRCRAAATTTIRDAELRQESHQHTDAGGLRACSLITYRAA